MPQALILELSDFPNLEDVWHEHIKNVSTVNNSVNNNLQLLDILDGELLWKYLTLDRAKMREIGLAIGADPDALISAIKEIDQSVSFF